METIQIMAHEKQGWKSALQTLQSEGSRSNDAIDPREQKKISTLHYKRRKLDKDVRNYTSNATRINSGDIERIGRKHGFHIEGTPFREN